MLTNPTIIGQSEYIDFPELNLQAVPARIDTGARTSAIWVSSVQERDGGLAFVLFDKQSSFYTGEKIFVSRFERRIVTPSNGLAEDRYMVKLLVVIGGRKIRARFTLANRSTQRYPVLVGRNILRGKFIVDIKHNNVNPDKQTGVSR
jgi:hypothetical protein